MCKVVNIVLSRRRGARRLLRSNHFSILRETRKRHRTDTSRHGPARPGPRTEHVPATRNATRRDAMRLLFHPIDLSGVGIFSPAKIFVPDVVQSDLFSCLKSITSLGSSALSFRIILLIPYPNCNTSQSTQTVIDGGSFCLSFFTANHSDVSHPL